MIQLKIECGECGQLHTLRHGRLGLVTLLCHGCKRELHAVVHWRDAIRATAQNPLVLTVVAHTEVPHG